MLGDEAVSGQPDSAFQIFASWQTVLFCLGISIFTHAGRVLVEALWKGAKTNDLWNEVGVRGGPLGTGMALVFVPKFPWPTQIAGSTLGMLFYGAACGVASAYVYAAFRSWVNAFARNGSTVAQKVNVMMKKPAVPGQTAPTQDDRPTPVEPPKAA